MKKYNEEKLVEAIKNKNNLSVAAILKDGELSSRNGNNYKLVYALSEKYNLDLSHLLGQAINKGQKLSYKRHDIQDYLTNKRKIHSCKLKLRLFEEKFKEQKCESCGLSQWLNQPVPLELHHIDGNSSNNQLDNLKVICPNCHTFTDTYKSKNVKSKLPVPEERILELIKESYNIKEVLTKLNLTAGANYYRIRKILKKNNVSFIQRPENIIPLISTETCLDVLDNPNYKPKKRSNFCVVCQKPAFNKYCSYECARADSSKIEWPTNEDLQKLVWEYPLVKLAEKLKVTDNAIRRRCLKNNIDIPKLGYWQRIQAGQTHEQAINPVIKVTIPQKVFTKEQVLEIRRLIQEGNLTLREIGEQFGVAHPVISNIKNNKTYKNI